MRAAGVLRGIRLTNKNREFKEPDQTYNQCPGGEVSLSLKFSRELRQAGGAAGGMGCHV